MDVPKADDTVGLNRLLEMVDRLEGRSYCYGRERSQFILRDFMEVSAPHFFPRPRRVSAQKTIIYILDCRDTVRVRARFPNRFYPQKSRIFPESGKKEPNPGL